MGFQKHFRFPAELDAEFWDLRALHFTRLLDGLVEVLGVQALVAAPVLGKLELFGVHVDAVYVGGTRQLGSLQSVISIMLQSSSNLSAGL